MVKDSDSPKMGETLEAMHYDQDLVRRA